MYTDSPTASRAQDHGQALTTPTQAFTILKLHVYGSGILLGTSCLPCLHITAASGRNGPPNRCQDAPQE